MKTKLAMICLITVILICNDAFAQKYHLEGKSVVGFNLGLFAGTKASNITPISGLNTEVLANGFAGNIFYSYWVRENLSLKFTAGILTGSANVAVSAFSTSQQASIVSPVLLGMNYYINELGFPDAVRPYIGGSVGMYIGREAANTMLAQKVHTESAFGGRAGLGIDVLLSSYFILGANAGYNLMANFSVPVGGNKNFNGADFSFQLGYIF
ncbi:MAG: hypothetical protein CVV24_08805 [Ignavibacteriae bacterium HGW-Ignavibacteriae-3]|nr:MAG: hypothetical protein CVV24_08805 [Ignavibacteriae bacterium HGW-Ignavibacteriae-3]